SAGDPSGDPGARARGTGPCGRSRSTVHARPGDPRGAKPGVSLRPGGVSTEVRRGASAHALAAARAGGPAAGTLAVRPDRRIELRTRNRRQTSIYRIYWIC